MNEYEILQGKFDIKTHANVFINYLEVIIQPDGTIEYAVPSHQEKLKQVCIKKHGLEEFLKELESPEAYRDYIKWLCNYSGCVSVWNEFCIKPDNIIISQLNSLRLLKNTFYENAKYLRLYQGEL